MVWHHQSHQEQQLKKDYLLKFYQDLVQRFSEMFQSQLEIGLVNDVKQ